ncbi:MAG TPA: DNA adenine methylase [Polyangia bacterium]|jgi:DNA adenine methylase
MPNPPSPLRYPGSKTHIIDYFEVLLRENLALGAELVEPYAGGASLSLGLLARDAVSSVRLVERDPLLFAFWKAVVTEPARLCDEIARVQVTLESWKRFRRYLEIDNPRGHDPVELGLACLFLNRTCFSGIISAGPIGGVSQSSQYRIDCRFNHSALMAAVEGAARFRDRIRVTFGDALAYMVRRRDAFARRGAVVYVDPPYYEKGYKLYRYHYEDKDHQRLARFLDASTFRWVVSYDNHPFVQRLFKNQKVVPIYLNYVVKQSRRAEELLISNLKLLDVEYRTSRRAASRAAHVSKVASTGSE